MLKKISLLFAMIVFSAMFFVSCDEDTLATGDAEITSLSNIIGNVGDEITINGSGFGSSQLATYKVMVGTVDANVVSWGSSEIKIKVPNVTPSNTATTIQVMAETNSNSVTFYVGSPNPVPPTALKATSINDSTVHVTWTPSEDESKGIFAGYELVVTNTTASPVVDKTYQVAKDAIPYEITGLTEGDIYSFAIKSKYNADAKNAMSLQAATITWSPATRFEETVNAVPIRIYGSESQFASGLKLFDALENGPSTYMSSSRGDWQFCLYTRDGLVEFGAARASKYSFASETQNSQVAETEYFADNLNEVFLGQALNSLTFSSKGINLNDAKFANQDKGVVLVVRTIDNVGDNNYAKILIKKIGGKFLQGSGNDVYLECVISYQKVKGIPYARF